jgi:hypothetical protein
MSVTEKTTTIDDAKLQSILTEVTSELDTMMKSEMEKLAKARPGEETTGEGEGDKSKSDPKGTSTSASDPAPAASATPDASGSDSAPPAADASASPPADDGSAPPADDGSASGSQDPAAEQGPIDPQQLMAEYSKLPPEDLKMHYLACKEALVQVLGAAGGDDGSAPPPDASASAPPPAAAPPPDAGSVPPTMKSEKGTELKAQQPGTGENPLHKAEVRVQNLEGAVSVLTAAVKKVMEAPLRKSVTSVADLAPVAAAAPVPTTREGIRAKLKTLDFGKLSKSDRELISGFDLNTVQADKVLHLLK